MVVVGLSLGWALSAGSASKRYKREREKSYDRLANAALEWAKETGKPVQVDAGGGIILAHPNGKIEAFSYAYGEKSE
jgi:hypothetical protein